MEEKLQKEIEEDVIDIREILFRYLAHWKWFLVSFVVCILLAFLYLRMTVPVYNISSVIMINDGKKGGGVSGELILFEGINVLGNSSTDNEMEVLKSKSLIRDVVKDLNLFVDYRGKRFLKETDLYDKTPVKADVTLLKAEDITFPIQILLKNLETTEISVELKEGDNTLLDTIYNAFPILLNSPHGIIALHRQKDILVENFSKLEITFTKPISVARQYLQSLTLEPTSKNSSVVRLEFKSTDKKRGEDFLNKLIEKYNTTAIDDKNKIAQKTAEFIEERINIIGDDLGNTEQEIEHYKKKEGLTEIKVNSELFLQESTGYERKQVENETQLKLVRFLKEYIAKSQNKEAVIPSNIGLTDAGLLSQINRYNEMLLERNRLLHTTSENNPVVVNQNLIISALNENIQALIKNIEESLLITRSNLNEQTAKFRRQIGNVPTQERKFVEIDRQRQIQSALFLMLLQKREENALAMAATTNKAKIIDETLADSSPISPKKTIILLVAIIFSLVIPVVILFVRDFFNIKFSSKADIEKEKLTNLPILAEIPLTNAPLLAEKDHLFLESFRLLRTNLHFMLDSPDKKVILVTSSIPGEGKTFVSSNIAHNFGLLNKRVLLVGMDIRNPQLAKFFKFPSNAGLTDYLSGSEKDIMNIVQKVPDMPNLNVILAGLVPPNPAELLSKDLLDEAISKLREQYDYIIIDSAPVEVVTDTLILSRVSDMTLYVCRADYTHKNVFTMIQGLQENRKLKNIALVVNAVDMSNHKNHYGYGYGYGKNYGQYKLK